MSASPRSLNFPNSPSNGHRNSIGQLPLPSTLTGGMSSSVQQRSLDNRSPSPAVPPSPTSPTSNAFNIHPQSPLSRVRSSESGTGFQRQSALRSTHTGAIQPSASFFRPSRPQQNYSRPSSAGSNPDDSHEGDVYPMASMNKRLSITSSDDHTGIPDSNTSDQQYFASSKALKQSKEGLIPIGEQSRTSVQHDRHGSSNNTNATRSAGRMVRNSVDMMISIGRRLSFDSSLKSPTTPHAHNGKIMDEEQGNYKEPNTLNVTATRHTRHPTPSPSPDPSFVPIPPRHQIPPYFAVPRIDPKTQKPMRKYQLHPSRNRFFLKGRILTGGDTPWAFIGCLMIALSIIGIWFGTTAIWWWHNESPAIAIIGAYLALVVLSSMLKTAFTDPGILPRNLDLDPPYPASSSDDGGIRAPMPRDLKVRADVVRVKYCPTCKIYRPPRSSHCKMCDNCVDGCDHHCQWVNNCVGRRNYATFFVLLCSAVTTLIFVICTSALHLYFLTRTNHIGFKDALNEGVGSAVTFSLSIIVIWPVTALLSYHLRLLLLNVTTIEQIRNQAHKTLVDGPAPPNPFSHGNWRKNFIAVLCRPTGYSWIEPEGIATEDKREVNPGLQTEDGGWDERP